MPRPPATVQHHHPARRAALCAAAGTALGLWGGALGEWGIGQRAEARADDNPAFLQWFETTWPTMEHRAPDLFMAGYDSVWVPPPSKASDPSSPGYDVFDRFDLGSPGSETAYGTENDLRALLAELHTAGVLVYADGIFNHNSGRSGSQAFIQAGGYPGFVLGLPGDFWGDFHDGSEQSHDPGGPNYDLWEGDLVGLIDIAQEEDLSYIRHPVEEGNPDNLPAGTIRNRPNPANTRFYPDLALPPAVFTNPANGQAWTIHPFNTADPNAGDPVLDNASGLLMRWAQWMLDDVGIDGFRLDAAKHIPQWFWNNFFDAAVHGRGRTFAGTPFTPFSFVESVAGNDFTQTYIRKDAFADRDALDLNGAGQLRDILNAQGLGAWQNALSAEIDNQDDGLLNGSQGVKHVWSHDNGSAGNGSSRPPVPGPDRYALPQNAYVLMKPGVGVVYHNGQELGDLFPVRGFWPREGNPTALGRINDDLTEIVRIANGYARGLYTPLNGAGPALNDVLIFERRTPLQNGHIANLLVGLNDRYDNGVQTRTVQTSFAPGTRLRELTGNAADPVIDPTGVIPELLIVGADRRVTVTVPNNRNTSGVAHHKGYIIYGPAAPSGTLTIAGASSVLPPDLNTVPVPRRRLTPIHVVTGDTFDIRLTTTQTDPLDPNTDDNAVFRIDAGFRDFNGNGVVDIGEDNRTVPGFEQFITERQPLYNSGLSQGTYVQAIDAALLDEGYHYVSAVAFRHRDDGGDPIYTDFRRVIYLDRVAPAIELLEPIEAQTFTVRVGALDRTAQRVHVLLDAPKEVDPLTLVNDANLAEQHDRREWRRSLGSLPVGVYSITVVAFEITGRASVLRTDVTLTIGSGDVDGDGSLTIDDLYAAHTLTKYRPAADLNRDGNFTPVDVRLLEALLRTMELRLMAEPQR